MAAVRESWGPKSDRLDAFGLAVAGKGVLPATGRDEWLSKLPAAACPLAELLLLEHDGLLKLHKRAQKEMLAEAHKHRVYGIVKSCPGLGEVRTAQLLPIVVTPYRFANKRAFWAYSGLGKDGSRSPAESTEAGRSPGRLALKQRRTVAHRAPTPGPDLWKLRTLAVTLFAASVWVKCVLTACPIEGISRALRDGGIALTVPSRRDSDYVWD